MKFICLGYADLEKIASMTEAEFKPLMEECFAYDDELRSGGHFAGGEALQSHVNAVTLRFRDGKVAVTGGPYAGKKGEVGGIFILEADGFNHAIALMSKHPGVKMGPFEIRPADETMNALIEERNKAAGKA